MDYVNKWRISRFRKAWSQAAGSVRWRREVATARAQAWFRGKKRGGKRGEISENGGTEPYKTIFYGDIPLHRPKKKASKMVGTSNLGSWNGHEYMGKYGKYMEHI